MNNSYQELKKATIGDIVSIIFIVVSALNIIASDKEKEYLLSNDVKDKMTAKNIYIIVLLVLFIIYIYFTYSNYQDYKNSVNNRNRVRLIGSILLILGILCLIYYRVGNDNDIMPVEL